MADYDTTIWPGSKAAAKMGAHTDFTDMIPVTGKMVLIDSSQRLNKLPVLFNPNKLPISIRVAMGALHPVGSSHPVLNYHHTEAITFPLELYWSAIHMHALGYKGLITLTEAVGWFASFCYPLKKGVAPPPLLIIWPKTLSMLVVVRSCQINYTHWDTKGNPRVIKINLQLTELRQASRYHEDMYAYGFAVSDEGHSMSGLGAGFNPGQRGRGAKVGGQR